MKINDVILASTIFISSVLIASPSHGMDTNNEQVKKDILNITAIFNGCELDDTCALNLLTDFTKNYQSEVMQTYLKVLESQKADIEFVAENCSTDQVFTFKKQCSECFTNIFTNENMFKIKSDAEYDQITNQVEQCLFAKSDELAKQGNVYAIFIVAQKALDENDQTKYKYWYAMLRENARSSSELTKVESCAPRLFQPLKNFVQSLKEIDNKLKQSK